VAQDHRRVHLELSALYGAAFFHFSAISRFANALMNTPPTTDRAWKPICLPDTVS